MKKRRWILIVAGAAASCLLLLLLLAGGQQRAFEQIRLELRQQGFKTDLADFDFSTSEPMRARVAALTNADFLWAAERTIGNPRIAGLQEGKPMIMQLVTGDSAVVVWKEVQLESISGDDIWPVLREKMAICRPELDAVCEAVQSGPISFDLNARDGMHMLLPPLGGLRAIEQALGERAVLELHDGNRDAAWTNLLGAIRMIAAYEPEPAEVCHLVRFRCVTIAFNTTWQVLQAQGWIEDQLTSLQREWEAVEFFEGLPETAAFDRACVVAALEWERQEPMGPLGVKLSDITRSPGSAWRTFTGHLRRARYRQSGIFDDQRVALLHYQDRELELRRAVTAGTWSSMCQIPGLTNQVPIPSRHISRTLVMLNSSNMRRSWQTQGRGLMGCAAEAETRRRLIVAAIAIERFRSLHGSYPSNLGELVPEFLASIPIDFMDGQPLRYRLTEDGHFVLYSVGLDCLDNGGTMRMQSPRERLLGGDADFGYPHNSDLVWPRPASDTEVNAYQTAEAQARQAMLDESAREEELEYRRAMAALEQLHAKQQHERIAEVTYQDKPLSQILRNEKTAGAMPGDLHEMLILRPHLTGKEPEIVAFELAISHDVVTNIGSLDLLVDVEPDESSVGGGGELQDCERATNGNCLLLWNTSYDTPGQHFLQARLLCTEQKDDWRTVEARGPVLPYVSSNLCQFFPFSAMFDSGGALLYAELVESNATYSIELRSPEGEICRTLTGSTSNGVIELEWDLKDEQGVTLPDDSFSALFHITLTGSDRSQVQQTWLNRMR